MRVRHVYLVGGLQQVNGVLQVAGRLVAAQQDDGIEAALTVVADPSLDLPGVEAHRSTTAALADLRRLLRGPNRPDVLHLHEIMRPGHRLLAIEAARAGVPWVVTVHAALDPRNLRRGRWKKAPYGALVERPFLRRAAGVVALSPAEATDVAGWIGEDHPPITVVPNPVDSALLDAPPWDPTPRDRPLVVTLSRYDVRQKGLDRLAELARRRPEVDVVVHGVQCRNEPHRTEALLRSAPPNFRLEPPLFGADKLRLLAEADLFAQPSRWEGLSASLTEALAVGTPCAVSGAVATTLPVEEAGLGLVLDDDPDQAASQLAAALADPPTLARWSTAGRTWARRALHPRTVASAHRALYEEVRGRWATRR